MAEQPKFERGNPLAFRATTQIHLGKIEKYIHEDDVVMFDGQTLDMGGGETHVLPQLRGAVLSGWLVPEADKTSTYVPKAADVKIRPAQAANITDRGEAMKVESADVEDQVVGVVGSREENPASALNDDARAVGTVKTPAFQKTKVTSMSDASRAISQLDNNPPPKADFTKTATGDVTQATAGETLTEILPNAASTAVGTKKTTTKKAKSRGRKGNEVVKLSTGADWDMARHWRTRARDAVRTHGQDQTTLNAIKNVEVPSVVKFINSKLG